jgi:hypothetical protein
MGASQKCSCVSWNGHLSRVFCEPKWARPRPWARQRSGRGSKTNRQSPHLQDKRSVRSHHDFLGFKTRSLTARSQFFHSDDSDIVGLLCVARALEGGESDIVSSHHVWNILQKERPDVAETLTKPIWYFDRKGETSAGEDPYIRTSVFYLEKGVDGRVYSKWDPYYVKSLSRFMDAGVIPHLSPQRMYCFGLLPSIQRKVLRAPTYSSGPGVLLQFLFASPNALDVLQIQVFQSNNANPEKIRGRSS